jgi:hypothetical protein
LRIWKGEPEGKRSPGRSKRGREDNIKISLQKVKWNDTHWTGLAKVVDKCQAIVAAVINFQDPLNVDNYLCS